jgi:hypothetical protein
LSEGEERGRKLVQRARYHGLETTSVSSSPEDQVPVDLFALNTEPDTEKKGLEAEKAESTTDHETVLVQEEKEGLNVTNIWFLRAFILVLGMIVASLLLAYDIIFLYNFELYGNVPSYFPWAWDAVYTDYGSVQNLFFGAEALAVITIGLCALGLYFILPRLKQESIASGL